MIFIESVLVIIKKMKVRFVLMITSDLHQNHIYRNITIHMGTTKSNLFSEQQNRFAALAKAIAHPARIAILEHLINKGSCVCGDIVNELPLSQSTISQHLKAMKDAGIIRGDIDGTYRCYCVDEECCSTFRNQLVQLFGKMTGGCC